MFKLLRRIVLNESAASFSIWSFSPPWGNYSSKLSWIKKKKKSINRGWLAIFLDPQKTVSQTYRDELSKDREGEINRPGFSQDACLFPDPTPATPTPSKRESCQQGPISKNISSGVTEMLSEVAGLSVLRINGVRHDIFLLAETEHPWGKDTDLSFVYSIGGDVLPGFDKCV